ncbi:MAG: hypothetical protein JWQ10_281 [Herbaspirillum sp.]|jgi:hypothetical protein|nr:hypothetical protein [Herbaspirillum sp.]
MLMVCIKYSYLYCRYKYKYVNIITIIFTTFWALPVDYSK